MNSRAALALFFVLSGFRPVARAEDRPGVVVIASVEQSQTIVHRKIGSTLFYVRLKAKVESVEAGADQVRGAPYLDLRCWREQERGHRAIPADGTRFRARIVHERDGSWSPCLPDGIELLDGGAERVFPAVPPRRINAGAIVAGLLGVLLLVAVAIGRTRRRRDRSWGPADEPR